MCRNHAEYNPSTASWFGSFLNLTGLQYLHCFPPQNMEHCMEEGATWRIFSPKAEYFGVGIFWSSLLPPRPELLYSSLVMTHLILSVSSIACKVKRTPKTESFKAPNNSNGCNDSNAFYLMQDLEYLCAIVVMYCKGVAPYVVLNSIILVFFSLHCLRAFILKIILK